LPEIHFTLLLEPGQCCRGLGVIAAAVGDGGSLDEATAEVDGRTIGRCGQECETVGYGSPVVLKQLFPERKD